MARKEKVTKVIGGDSFETASRKRPVWLAGVNPPESGKKGSAAARKALKALIEGETVKIDTVARDRFGRSIAKVKLGRRSVNKAMQEQLSS